MRSVEIIDRLYKMGLVEGVSATTAIRVTDHTYVDGEVRDLDEMGNHEGQCGTKCTLQATAPVLRPTTGLVC